MGTPEPQPPVPGPPVGERSRSVGRVGWVVHRGAVPAGDTAGVPAASGSSMRRTAAAGGRRSGSLTSRASRTGSSGPALAGRPGGSCRMAPSVAAGPARSNGATPSTANHSVAPSAHRSAAGPACSPLACSGATNGSDPNAAVSARSAPRSPGPATPAQGPGGTGEGPLGVVLERGDAEVGQLDPAARGDHDVGRLDVVVDDPGPVGRVQRLQQLQPDPGRRRMPHRPRPVDQVAQRRGLDQLHDQEQAVVGLDGVMEGDHPRMVEPGRRPGLPQRPFPQRLPPRPGRARQLDLLDGHRPAEQHVVRPPHRAHPAPAQRPPEDIAARDQPAVGARSHDARQYVRSPVHGSRERWGGAWWAAMAGIRPAAGCWGCWGLWIPANLPLPGPLRSPSGGLEPGL